jgi:hypothetical protein
MQVMLVGGVLLLIDTWFRWQEVSAKIGGVTVVSAGINAWHGFWGIIMCLALLVLLAWMIARLFGVKIPLPFSDTLVAAGLAAIILLFAFIKILVDDYSTVWSWIGLVLAAVIVIGAWFEVQAAGGVDSLRSEMTSMRRTEPPASSPPPPPETPSGPSETAS